MELSILTEFADSEFLLELINRVWIKFSNSVHQEFREEQLPPGDRAVARRAQRNWREWFRNKLVKKNCHQNQADHCGFQSEGHAHELSDAQWSVSIQLKLRSTGDIPAYIDELKKQQANARNKTERNASTRKLRSATRPPGFERQKGLPIYM